MEKRSLNVEPRSEFGKNVNRRLRNDGFIPAVLYSHGKTESIKVGEKDFFNIFKGYVSESVMLNLNMNGSEHMAFVKDYHMDPVSGEMVHIDFFKVTLGESIHTRVPVEVIGSAKGVKVGGVLEIGEREIVVECLPRDLTEKIVVDVTDLELGHFIHAKDIKFEGSMKLISNPDAVIVGVHTPKAASEEGEEASVAIEGADSSAGSSEE